MPSRVVNIRFFLALLAMLVCVAVLWASDVSLASARLASSPWPMFLHDAQHTGRSEYKGPDIPKEKWIYKKNIDVTGSSPTIGYGTIHVGSIDGKGYLFDRIDSESKKDTVLRWTVDISADITTSMAVDDNASTYFGTGDGNLHAVHPTGLVKWRF